MEYYTVTYEVKSDDMAKAAHEIAVGQSIGNPNVRSEIEMSDNIQEFAAVVESIEDNIVKIKFPLDAFVWPNISQLLCIIQGGQSDIGNVEECRVIDIEGLPYMNEPVLGMKAFKERVGAENRPLFGAIVKPKSGLTMEQLKTIVEQMIDGGADFIKEDEIMANQNYLPLEQRATVIQSMIQEKGWKGVYCYCINADPLELVDNLCILKEHGAEGCHINFWSGLGAYTSSHAAQLVTHYQRSGIRILTDPRNRFSISWPVLVKLGIMSGIDTIHVGMLGGYYPEGESEEETMQAIQMCIDNDRVACLSCGMNPDTAREIRGMIGNDWLANVGGWLHTGESIYEKVKEMRDSLDEG